jgi:hypothetical protein
MHSPVESFTSHALFTDMMDLVWPITKETIAELRKNRGREQEIRKEAYNKLTEAQRYGLQVAESVRALYRGFSIMEQAGRYMRVFPSQLKRGKNAPTRDEWVDYHFALFTVATTSLLDLSLLLVADVHQIGLSRRHCTYPVITHCQSVGTGVREALKGLKGALQAHEERRHAFVHRGIQPDIDAATGLTHMELLRTLGLLARIKPDHEDIRTDLFESWEFGLIEIRPAIDEMLRQSERAVLALLDVLLTEWRRRRDGIATIEAFAKTLAKE